MEEKVKLIEGQLNSIKASLTKKLQDAVKENKLLNEKVDELSSIIADRDRKILGCLTEIATLQDAFELLLSDWVEELEKRGVSQENIIAQRESFNKVMYWKTGKEYE